MPSHLEVGKRGEDVAARWLSARRFRILHTNLRLGKLGELDIVAREGGCLVLVEVKSKIAGQHLGGLVNITPAKQRKLRDLGAMYLQRFGGDHSSVRFDALEVEFADNQLRRHTVRHVRDAFRG